MKTELIEYHQSQARFNVLRASDYPPDSHECLKHNARIIFHERCVAWLEGPKNPDLPAIWDGDAWVRPMTPGHKRYIKEKRGTI